MLVPAAIGTNMALCSFKILVQGLQILTTDMLAPASTGISMAIVAMGTKAADLWRLAL